MKKITEVKLETTTGEEVNLRDLLPPDQQSKLDECLERLNKYVTIEQEETKD